MNKVDLHLHKIPTISAENFTFSLTQLSEYVGSAELDAIAIKNHDRFNLEQFHEIVELCCISPQNNDRF
ncbi:MAG: hypothetical protein HRT54_02825 [Colwellia sp.]|nr:hypothetical protein [Colwellia sp.]